jgi:uncharacterized protein
MRKRLITVAVVVGLLALPFIIHGVYRRVTALPEEITIATGPEHGRYRVVAASLGREIERRLDLRVRFVHTSGSLENLRLIRQGRAHFALFQPGTHRILDEPLEGPRQPAFVANLYSEVVHLIVRREAGLGGADDLQGRRVAVGERGSGDYAMSRVLLEHLGLDEQRDIEPLYISFEEIRRRFEDEADPLDAAFVTVGVQAPILRELFQDGRCDILAIPHVEALAANHLSLEPWTLPAGLYRSRDPVEPPGEIHTVAVRAQLLTWEDASASLVGAVTEIVLAEEFIKQNSLSELFNGGRDFARRKPDFDVHPGAQNVYDPELRPLLNPDFVEATEGMRSFVVSILIAGFLAFRWYQKRSERRQEHRLDKYIQALLDIERRQIALDQHEGYADIGPLQDLLDEVTTLRREALRKLTAHELKEDRAADCFLEMCHSVSDKINAKLSRQRLDKRFAELMGAWSPAAGPSCGPTHPTKSAADDAGAASAEGAAGRNATADTGPTDRPSSAAR